MAVLYVCHFYIKFLISLKNIIRVARSCIQSFFGILNWPGDLGAAVAHPEAPRVWCSKMVKIPIKCTLDSLTFIVVLRLKTNLTFVLIQNLAWFRVSKLSLAAIKLFKLYSWAVWLISVDILSCKFWYVMVRFEKAGLRWTYQCIYSVSQSHSYIWRLLFMYRKEFILKLHFLNI